MIRHTDIGIYQLEALNQLAHIDTALSLEKKRTSDRRAIGWSRTICSKATHT